jgi:hypothetical protein
MSLATDRIEASFKAWSSQSHAYLTLLEMGQFERAAAVGMDAVTLFERWCDVVAEEHKRIHVKLKAVIAALEVLAPMVDPENKALLVKWVEDCFNAGMAASG